MKEAKLITTPTGADAAAIEAVALATQLFTAAEMEAFSAFIAETLEDEVRTRWFVASDSSSAIVGAAVIQDELMGQGVANLLFVGVAPAGRRAGHAGALIAAAEGAAAHAGHRLIIIETASGETQVAARALYAKAGYHHEATIREFYAPGVDKLIYRKSLEAAGSG